MESLVLKNAITDRGGTATHCIYEEWRDVFGVVLNPYKTGFDLICISFLDVHFHDIQNKYLK